MKPQTENISNLATKGKEAKQQKKGGFLSRVGNLLFHEDLFFRVMGYLLFGIIFFLLAWGVCFFMFHKPNMLNKSFMVEKFLQFKWHQAFGAWGAQSFGETWKVFGLEIVVKEFFAVAALMVQYFINYLIIALVFVFGLNLFRVGRLNLSLIYLASYAVLWGAVAGSDSMLYPTGENKVFGTLLTFARFGLPLLFSYILLAASTTNLAIWNAPKWTEWRWEKLRPFWPWKLNGEQKEFLIYGLLFLLAACFAEARLFVMYYGG